MNHGRNRETYGDYLPTYVRERCLGDDTGPSEEVSFYTLYAIKVDERSRIPPVSKTDTVVVWSSTQIEDNAQDEHPGDRDYFNGTKGDN